MIPWSSIFPEHVSTTLHTIESWISSIFFFLFLITIGPWFLFLAYDVVLYFVRTIAYEIPFIGGRARGKERPRAPSLKERPGGDPRVLGIGVPAATYVEGEDLDEERRHDEQRGDQGGIAQQNGYDVKEDGYITSEGDEEDEAARSERMFSIGATEERAGWAEVNARRRKGYQDGRGAI